MSEAILKGAFSVTLAEADFNRILAKGLAPYVTYGGSASQIDKEIVVHDVTFDDARHVEITVEMAEKGAE